MAQGLTFHAPRMPVVSDCDRAARGPRGSGTTRTTGSAGPRGGAVPDGDRALEARASTRFVELGPDGGADRAGAGSCGCRSRRPSSSALRATATRSRRLLTALATGCTSRRPGRLGAVFAGTGPGAVDLPTYAFQRQRYWLDAPDRRNPPRDAGRRPGSGRRSSGSDAAALADAARRRRRPRRWSDVAARAVVVAARRRERSTVDGWRYRVGWQPVLDRSPRVLTRTLAGRRSGRTTWRDVSAARRGLAERGVDVVGRADRRATEPTRWLRAGSAAATDACRRAVAAGLGDADRAVAAHRWRLVAGPRRRRARRSAVVVTRGAVAVGPADRRGEPGQARSGASAGWSALEHPRALGRPGRPAARRSSAAPATGLAAVLAGARRRGPGRGARRRRLRPAAGARAAVRPPAIAGVRAARCWSPAVPARSARTSPAGSPANGAEHLVLTSRRGLDAPGAAELRRRTGRAGRRGDGRRLRRRRPGRAGRTCSPRLPAESADRGGARRRRAATTASRLAARRAASTRCCAAKVDGARHLDELTRRPLDAFVLFSSFAGVWGGAGRPPTPPPTPTWTRSPSSAGRDGLPATSVAWGPWAEAAWPPTSAVAARLRRRGPAADGTGAGGRRAGRGAGRTDDAAVTVADVDWAAVRAGVHRRAGPLRSSRTCSPQVRRGRRRDVAARRRSPRSAERLAGLPPAERDRLAARAGARRRSPRCSATPRPRRSSRTGRSRSWASTR